MKIVRDNYEIDRVRAWAEEGNPCFGPWQSHEHGYDEGYAQGIADVLDWLKGETNIAPDR